MKKKYFVALFLLGSMFVYSSPVTTKPSVPIELHQIQNFRQISTSQNANLMDLYKKLDENILKCGDEKIISEYLVKVNLSVHHYLQTNYPQYGSLKQIDIHDQDYIVFGLVYALAEYGGYLKSDALKTAPIPSWMQCVAAVLGVTSIYELISNAGTATYANVWSIVKKTSETICRMAGSWSCTLGNC